MKKRLLSLALCLALCLGLLPVGVLATDSGGVYIPSTSTGGGVYEPTDGEEAKTLEDTGVKYIGADGSEQTCKEFTEITEAPDSLPEGWYVVKGKVDVTTHNLFASGTVNLILCDGAELNLSLGLHVYGNAVLNIYGQSGGTGKLIATGENGYTAIGIGPNTGNASGTIHIYGGTITAQAHFGAQAIGKSLNNQHQLMDGYLEVQLAQSMKCVKTDEPDQPCSWENTDGTSVTISKCTDHKYRYQIDGEYHFKRCDLCGTVAPDGESQLHSYENWTPAEDGVNHIGTCVCGATTTEAHTLAIQPDADGLTHSQTCSECGYKSESERHRFVEEDIYGYKWQRCSCGALLAAEYNGEQYGSLQAAVDAASAHGDKVTLAQNVPESIKVSGGNVTIDLNGHDWGSSDTYNDTLTVTGGNVTLQNGTLGRSGSRALFLSGGEVKIGENMTLWGHYGSVSTNPAIAVQNTEAKLTLGKDTKLIYGMKVPEGKTLSDYLLNGAMFVKCNFDDNSNLKITDEFVPNAYTINEYIDHIAIVEHTHSFDDNDYICSCGAKAVASVTKSDNVTYYTDLAEAIANADGGTVTMLNDVTVTSPIRATSDFTLDLNGKTITGNSNVASIFLIYRNGNVIIRDTNRTNVGLIKATSYATGNGLFNLQGGKLTIQDGTFQANKATIYAMSGELVINGGTFTGEVFIYHPVSTSISGGTFSQIHAASSTISSLLANGYGFKRISNNAWLSSRDIIQEYSYSQVTVTEAPDLNIAITANQVYSYGDPIDLTANLSGLDSNTSVTYQWYFVDFNDNHHILDPIAEASENTYAPSNLLPNKYDSATSSYQQYTYYCTATCDGYTVGKKVNFRVTKADLSNATVTITNPEQLVFVPNPGSSNQSTGIAIDCKNHIKVTLPNGTEVPSNSYTVTGNVASSAGKHTLTIQGQDSCYTGSKSIEWTLLPFKLTKPALLSIIKDYDGTTDLPELALHEFYHNDSSTGSLITLNQGTDFTVEGNFDSAEIGYRTANLTFHLLNQNYSFADGSDTLVCKASTTSSISIRILEATPVGAPTLSKSALTYGETLSAITLSGSMKNKANNEPVEGTFTWQTPDEKPGVAEKHVAIWIFTPKDTTHYKTVAGEVTIPVNKATPTGAPKYTAITTNGKTLKDAALTAEGGTFSVPGHVQWVDEKGDEIDVNTEVKANTAYTWKFTPQDEQNYNDLTGTITLWHKSSSGSSSGSVTPGTKTDTVKNPDGSTTKTETKADGSKTETTTASSSGGSTGTTVTKTDAKGNTTTEASAKLSDRDVKEAQEKGEAVTVPVKEIQAAKDANAATKIKIDVPNNANKTTVEIPVENVTSGTVAVIVHEDGTEELVKDSKPTEHGVQLELSGSTTVKIIDNSKTFDDTKDHWSRDEVNFVAARDLFNGVGGNRFGVSEPMTRGMVNTVLARLAGVDTTPSQGQAWYEVGTDWAKKNGISDGTNPTAPVTREQLATLLYRYAGSPSVSGTLHAADAASVSDYAKDALLWANQNGIVNGVGSNTIAPKDNAQRAQVAAMLVRYLQNQ